VVSDRHLVLRDVFSIIEIPCYNGRLVRVVIGWSNFQSEVYIPHMDRIHGCVPIVPSKKRRPVEFGRFLSTLSEVLTTSEYTGQSHHKRKIKAKPKVRRSTFGR
jgi:hypothetical protein